MKRRKFLTDSAMVGAALTLSSSGAVASNKLSPAPTIAEQLHRAMIWSAERIRIPLRLDGKAVDIADVVPSVNSSDKSSDMHAVFAKEFVLRKPPMSAQLHIFAYTRYRLYLNGRYVGRGPSRYQNQRPEYDSWDVAAMLSKGRNIINVLAHRDAPTGRIMFHEPGMAALLELRDERGLNRQVPSDETWRAEPERSFGPREVAWASIQESIDARLMQEWRDIRHDFSAWPAAVKVGGDQYPPLWPRSIPLLRETSMAWHDEQSLPYVLRAGMRFELKLDRIILGYHHLEFEAEEGSEIEIGYDLPEGQNSGKSRYIARAGWQRFEGGDTFAFKSLSVVALSGKIKIISVAAIEVRYPFDRVGRFESSDASLNRLWELAARSLLVLSEDAYVDCADRERVEWTDETPPAFECTRVMMAGPKPGGGLLYGDPRLLRALLQRIALTQQADGQIKAHSCSERWDIHAIMEDRSCDWVIALRQYFDSSGDVEFVRSMWPTLSRLMRWFLGRRTTRGLVQAREWEVWDNPLRYQVCEGAGLNAFVYRALVDAAYLGQHSGSSEQAEGFSEAAHALATAFNDLLWDDSAGAYFGGLFGAGSRLAEQLNGKMFAGPIVDGHYRPTLQAALFALENGIVPPERRERLQAFVSEHQDDADSVMTHYFLFRFLYRRDNAASDRRVLDLMRTKWRPMLESPWQTSWESLEDNGGSKVHIYGMAPGYFLSAYVLGVRVEGAARDGLIIIEPRPGDLRFAKGIVVTEFGPVNVAWQCALDGAMSLQFEVPEKCRAALRMPRLRESASLRINGHTIGPSATESNQRLTLEAGSYEVVQVLANSPLSRRDHPAGAALATRCPVATGPAA